MSEATKAETDLRAMIADLREKIGQTWMHPKIREELKLLLNNTEVMIDETKKNERDYSGDA